jgi:hypothetical protein
MPSMIKRVIRCLAPALLLLAAHVPAAVAQGIDSPYRFLTTRQAGSVFAGYLSTSKGALDLGPESGPFFGARYGINISGPFALEAELGYYSRTRMVWDTVPGDTTRRTVGDADFSVIVATGALRFNLTGARTYHGLLPYVLFGAGASIDISPQSSPDRDLPSDVRFDLGTGFAGALGGGLEWMPAEHFGLRLDGRALLWKLKTPRAFLLKGGQSRVLPPDEWAQNFAFTAGLVLRF